MSAEQTTAATEPEAAESVETLTYIGRRPGGKGALLYAYLDAAGQAAYYDKALVAATAIGSRVAITHPAGRPTSYYTAGDRAPRLVGFAEDADPDQLLDWQVRDRAAWQRKADADAAKRAARRADALEDHVGALVAASAALSWDERTAFASWIAHRIQKGR